MAEKVDIKIDKLEAARRQLVTAIRLFFEDREPASVFSLAQNAREILATLCELRSVAGFNSHALKTNANLTQKELYRLANQDRNFFKHADKDPDSVLENFTDQQNDSVLFVTGYDLGMLTGKLPIEVQVYEAWYFSCYPGKMSEKSRPAHETNLKTLFPNIGLIDRTHKKKMGFKQLMRALKDHNLLNDPRTDISQLRYWK